MSLTLARKAELKTESTCGHGCCHRDATAQVPDDGAFPDEGFAEVTEGAEGAEEAAEAEWPQEAPIGFRTGRVATVSTALGCSAVAEAKIKGEIGGVEVVRASRIGS